MLSSTNIITLTSVLSTCLVISAVPFDNLEANGKIVGGLEAAEGQFPYQVSVRRSGSHTCGGSILNSRWILTAAHCVAHYDISTLAVVAGTTSRSSGNITRQVSQMIEHEEYDFLSLRNDIALLEIDDDLEFSENIQPIELETEEVGTVDCVVSGWGRLSAEGERPEQLQYLLTRTVTLDYCREVWDSVVVHDTEICTLAREGAGFCSGDSGSPLAADGRQIGVVSWGNPCGTGIPDVYVKVSSYVLWIGDVVNL